MSRLPPRSVRGRAPLALAHPTTRTAGGPAAAPRCQILPHTNEKSQVPQKRYLTFLAGAEGLGLGCRLGRLVACVPLARTRPRHAVLEWMWENAEGSGGGPVSPNSPRKPQRGWCWFGAVRKISGAKQAKTGGKTDPGTLKICGRVNKEKGKPYSSFFKAFSNSGKSP